MRLLVPVLPENQWQMYSECSHHSSSCITATFPVFLLWYCPFSTAGQFFHVNLIQSTAPTHLGNLHSPYMSCIYFDTFFIAGLFRKRRPYICSTSFHMCWNYVLHVSHPIRAVSSMSSYALPIRKLRNSIQTFTAGSITTLPNASDPRFQTIGRKLIRSGTILQKSAHGTPTRRRKSCTL